MKIYIGWVEWRDGVGWERVSRPGSWSREFKKAKWIDRCLRRRYGSPRSA